METHEVKRVVIAGGGTAGWLAAAALSHQLGKVLDITLIESDEIGTIGVGEATIPPIRVFHKLLQIDEQEFMRATAATFKLGISFENWGLKGDHYIHSFGRNGKPTWMCEFHNFWLRSLELGVQSELGEYCFELQAAKAGKFGISQQVDVNFAYHFDASQYSSNDEGLRLMSDNSSPNFPRPSPLTRRESALAIEPARLPLFSLACRCIRLVECRDVAGFDALQTFWRAFAIWTP